MAKTQQVGAVPDGLSPALTRILKELRAAVTATAEVVHSKANPIVTMASLQAYVTKKTNTNVSGAEKPTVPTIAAVQQVSGGVAVTFDPPDYIGHQEVQVYRAPANQPVTTAQPVGTLEPPATTFTDTSGEPATDYSYFFYNVNVNGVKSTAHNVEGTLLTSGGISYSGLNDTMGSMPADGATRNSTLPADMDTEAGLTVLHNLLGNDALVTNSSAGGVYNYTGFGVGLAGMPVGKLGVIPAQSTMSIMGNITCATGAATNPRFTLSFYDNTGTLISSFDTSVSDATTDTMVFGQGLLIPANCAYIGYATNWDALGGDTITFGPTTLVLGAVALLAAPGLYRHKIDTVDSLDDGTTYGKVVQSALTNNTVDVSKGGVVNKNTSNITDDAGYSQTSSFGGINDLPTSYTAFPLTDVQPILPGTSGPRHTWFSDAGGTPYEDQVYDTNVNFAGENLSDLTVSSASYTKWGNPIGFANPGQAVNIFATVSGFMYATTITNENVGSLKLQYSLDGGVTWTDGVITSGTMLPSAGYTTTTYTPITATLNLQGVTPTADVQIRAMGSRTTGSVNLVFSGGVLSVQLVPVSSFYVVDPLSASAPATASMSCSASSGSCKATKKISVSIPGGQSPFTESWAVVSGTGTITAGATSVTCTVSDTEAVADPAATHTTTIACAVTDSQSYTPTAGSQSSGTATLTIGAHNIPVGATLNVSGCVPANYNGTGLVITGITSTAIKYAVAGAPGAMTTFGTINNVTVETGNCVITGTFTKYYAPISASLTITNGAYWGTGSMTASGTSKANASGGNGSYTYSHSIVSQTGGGAATIISGATSQTCTVSDTRHPITGGSLTDSINMKCVVNDTRGTGAVTLTGTMTLDFINTT